MFGIGRLSSGDFLGGQWLIVLPLIVGPITVQTASLMFVELVYLGEISNSLKVMKIELRALGAGFHLRFSAPVRASTQIICVPMILSRPMFDDHVVAA